jgi:hypothetical protein
MIFGWAAYLSAVATIGTAITAVLFFSVGERFGRLNDAVSVLQMVLMIPVAVGLYLMTRSGGAGLALAATVLGALAMLVAAVLQALLVAKVVQYEQTIAAVLAAGGVIGLWLLLGNVLALRAAALPAGLAACGIATGAGYLLLAVGFRLGGQEHALSYVGAGLVFVGYSVWAIGLGWMATSGGL